MQVKKIQHRLEITVAGNATMAYAGNACQGIVLDASVDASAFTNYNVDIFIEPGTDLVGKIFNLKFVGTPTSVVKEVNHDLNALNTSVGEWVSLTGTVDLSTMGGFKEFAITTNLANAFIMIIFIFIDDTSGGGGGETPATTTYCSTEVTHFNLAAETASKIVLTIENSGVIKLLFQLLQLVLLQLMYLLSAQTTVAVQFLLLISLVVLHHLI